ncbi:S8 family serine peptidase [Algoriphagus machipongonensis]|uniref:Exported serine protease, subtilase family n=1 Tax=Algoriphagus machipongonensis TaxID=388413 RepID=A3HTG9_9BACT|nr:S8 family serine peptidase [Algoriphagus machipongonensis]EAZ83137.1 exported serine protease, subtilase family [Algoriphagus machipongonensis]
MGFYKFLLVAAFWLGVCSLSFAQDRYAVFFKYKPQDTFSLSEPGNFLSSKALIRRSREGVPIDSLDLPVAQKYIDELGEKAHYLLYPSKWLNALVLVTDEVGANEIEALPFVERVEMVALDYLPSPNARIGRRLFASASLKICLPLNHRKLGTNENPYDFQNSLLGIPDMHEAGFTGKGITVAVFDAGFPGTDEASALSHLFANNQIIKANNFVRPWSDNIFTANQHGTNVLSLIAANEEGILKSGAPDADYYLAITEEDATEYKIEEYNWVRAAEVADSLGVDIINSSVGYWDFDDPTMNYSLEDLDGKTTVIAQGANIAAQRGILIINSVGNYGPKESTLISPADSEMVIAVGAVDKNLEVSNFSSRGPTGDGRLKPDLTTYGNGVALIRSNGNLGYSNGTSFSAPQITALAAGLWQGKPEWTRAQLVENLFRSATQSEEKDNLLGFGIPNFRDAYYGEILAVTGEENFAWKLYPNPLAEDDLTIYFGQGLSAEFTLIDMNGKTLQSAVLLRNSPKDPFRTSLQGIKPGFYVVQMRDSRNIKRTKLFRQ